MKPSPCQWLVAVGGFSPRTDISTSYAHFSDSPPLAIIQVCEPCCDQKLSSKVTKKNKCN